MQLKFNVYEDSDLFKLLEKNYFSKSLISLLYNNKLIKINGEIIKYPYVVKKGDEVLVFLNDEESNIVLSDKEIEIIYEDDFILIVNKPFGLSVIGSKRHYNDNLASRVLNYFHLKNIKSTVHIVNRLDKDTEGLVLIAKHQYIHGLFKKKNIDITKKYYLLVEGNIKKGGRIIVNIDKDGNSVKRVIKDSGKKSITDYEVVQNYRKISLVEATLITGRTHQIRVTFSHIGFPLVGDCLYGSGDNLMLQSHYLRFNHPFTDELIEINLELSERLKEQIKKNNIL